MYDLENIDRRKLIFGMIFLLSNRLQTIMDNSMDELTAKQWFMLMTLEMFTEPPTLKQLAVMCDCSHQNTKQLVLKLEEKGFVRIESDTADRRAMRIVATDKCGEWDAAHREFEDNFLDSMFADLTAEETSVTSLVQMKIYNKLEQMKGYER